MRYKLNKIVVAILLVLSISISIIAINANAEDENATKIDSCERVWKEYDATTVAEHLAKENDYPTLDNYLFAGWYTDKVCDSAHALKGNTPTGTTYALFVPKHVLSVKAQVSAHLIDGKITEEDDAASIRFVTTVDSLLYKKVGFEVTYIGKDGTQKESFSETNTVYERLYVTGTDQTWSETPYGSFCGVSQFFRAHTINGVPSSHYDTVFTVKPYWITLDDDKVYGVQDTKTIAQGAKVDITINNDGTNGTASADQDWYLPGETVTLTGKGSKGYRCIGMTVNGTDYELDANGTYSFVTEKGKKYTVSGIYENVFDLDGNSPAWDLDHLDEGIVTLLKHDKLYALKLAKKYKNIDLTVTARDYAESESVARTDIYFLFDNGAYISFSASIVEEGEHAGELALTTINKGLYANDNDGKYIYPRLTVWGYLSEEMTTQYLTTGLDIRVVRYGTEICLFAGEDMELITVVDLAKNTHYPVTEDTAATIEIRHWGDSGVNVEIPFKLTEETEEFDVTTLTFEESPNGTVISNKTAYVKGEIIELTGKGNSAYRCTGLIINGEKVSLEPGESYSFKATESNYTISGCFERVFENHDTWNLTRLDEGVISLPVNGTKGQYAEGWLELYGKFTDIDITVTARDYDVNTKDDRTDILFVFENGAHVSFGLCTFSDGTVGISTFNKENNKNDPSNIYEPGAWGERVDNQALGLYRGDGVKFRVQRVGTKIYLYVNDKQHSKVADLTNNKDYPVTAEMKANVYIRRWGDYTSEVNIPFSISAAPDKELFYTNSKKTDIADPFILDNTKVDGYYYMYGTPATSTCYRSTNLMDWTSMGAPIDKKKASTDVQNALTTDDWAPEVVYDADTETYYMFFSATPAKASGEYSGNAHGLLMVATSKSPYKDFQLVDFTDKNSCGEDNVHYPNSAYPQYYAKYALFEPIWQGQFCNKDKTYTSDYGGHYPAIDPHPYEDETGKYLFWVDQDGHDRICVVQMENWLKPIWKTAKVLTGGGYYTPEDYAFVQKYGALIGTLSGVKEVPYDKKGGTNHYVNEAPEVVKHNGKYYLTYSTGAYANNTYQVIQAVSDEGIMGPYRKLNADEGAILLSAEATGSKEVTGTGHHSFVTAGDKLYMIYHRHNSTTTMGGARNHAIDEVKWITIKDKDGNDLDVMYANGPTSTLQPKIDAYSEYVNIAEDKKRVTVSANTTAGNISCLTDGYLSVHKNMNATFIENVKETTISETTTFTFDFESARAVRGIMVYNSKTRSTCFMNISQIKLVCEENGVETTHTIENVQFSSDYYTSDYVKPGAAAYTEFDEMNVKSIEITIDVPNGQSSVGISEVRILGK